MKNFHIGDKGETSLVGGKVSKDDVRVEAYGSIDELNSFIGLSRSMLSDQNLSKILEKIQNDLFIVGAELATITTKGTQSKISPKDVAWIEEKSDDMEKELMPIMKFVLPNGSQPAAALHVARAVCRRAERQIVSLSNKENINPEIIRYVNRLSDMIFIMARLVNQKMGIKEATWGPEGLLGV